jgi:hypothetical protein
MRSTLFVSLIAAAVLGCGDHGLPGGDDMGEDMGMPDDLSGVVFDDQRHIVTFSEFAMDYATAVCAHYMTCGQLDAAQMNACIERNLRHSGWDQDVEISKGRMEINELQCLDAISKARCDNSDTVTWGGKCLQFLYIAHQANGAACLADVECTSGFCQRGGSDAGIPEQVTGCPGTCANPKAQNAPCRLATDCASDSACVPVSGTASQCMKLAALNEACRSNPASPSFDPSKLPCQFGLNCPTFPTAMPATCVVPSTQTALHGACDPFQGAVAPAAACGTGMYCQVQYTAGAACTGQPTDCQTVFGSYCDTGAGTCMNPSGGKCETKLASGAVCDPHNEGAFTFVDNQCADGSSCYQAGAQAMPTCQAFGAANADCNTIGGTGSTCKVGFNCTAGKCALWSSDGQTCSGNAQCPSFLPPGQDVCIADNADAGTAHTCQAAKNFGATCLPGFEDSLCAPSDNVGSTHCAPTGSSGTCVPNCF